MIPTILISVSVLLLILLSYSFLMLIRNDWVFRERIRLMDERFKRNSTYRPLDEDYLTYDQMMRRFWIWDVERMRK